MGQARNTNQGCREQLCLQDGYDPVPLPRVDPSCINVQFETERQRRLPRDKKKGKEVFLPVVESTVNASLQDCINRSARPKKCRNQKRAQPFRTMCTNLYLDMPDRPKIATITPPTKP